MKAPLIGITTYQTSNPHGDPILAIGEHYVQAIAQAGGNPVLLPLGLAERQLTSLVHRLDGILFSGGGDIDPTYYGTEKTPEVKNVNADRDRVEIFLVHKAASTGLPFLGICRGLQVINVALGGTLYTDISKGHSQAIKHDYYPDWPRDHLPHSVRLESNCRLAKILGASEPAVNSLHHQGVRMLAPDLKACGWAPDNLIEAFELSEHPFGLAVQWHPEWLVNQPECSVPMRGLFRAFVEATTR